MKKVLIYAYTYFNLGDDLFIHVLTQRYPQTNFILYAPKDYKKHFNHLDHVHIIPNDSIHIRGVNYFFSLFGMYYFCQRWTAKKCDAVVHIGGSLFIQFEEWRQDLEMTKSMQIKGKPFFLLGTNFGPYTDEKFYKEHKQLFNTYTDICFREKHSYDLFKALKNVRLAADTIFRLPTNKSEVVSNKQTNMIAISVIKPSIRKSLQNSDAVYYEKLSEIIVYFIQKGYKLTLMSFCEYEQDHEAIEMIMKRIPASDQHAITKHFYRGDIEAALNVIKASCFVIATRFHAMILGWIYEKPVFPIVYSEKMTNVMEDTGFTGPYTDFQHLHSLQVSDVFAASKLEPIDISKQAKRAEKQFEILDMYLM